MSRSRATLWRRWDEKLAELQDGELDTVNAAAETWTKGFTAALGAFSLVAFAGGLTTIDRLAAPMGAVVRVLTSAALVLALASTFFSARASAASSPGVITGIDPLVLRDAYRRTAAVRLADLHRARRLGVAAVLLVFAGAAIVVWAAPKPAAAPNVLVVVDGEMRCGPLVRSGDAVSVGPGDGRVTQAVPVDDCP